jgi:hypothetical protein
MVRALFFLFCLVGAASAGPWPREEGKGFLSFSFDIDAETGDDNFLSFYLEYGLGKDRTFGIDRRESSDEIAKTIAFLRYPIGSADRRLKLAYEIGLGVVDNHGALRPGFSLGSGLELGQRSGWWTWDSRAILYDDLEDGLFEADITLGIQMTGRTKVIMQLQGGVPSEGDAYAKLAPSFVLQNGAGRHYTLGLTAGVVEVDEVKINIGLWQEF